MRTTVKKKIISSSIMYFMAFALPVYIVMIILYCGEFYPFGDKTMFIMDMRDQYLEFFAYLRNMLAGDNSIFFSWSRSMGGNFMGLFAYYLASPLSFIVCLFPLEKMYAAIVVLTVIKIGLCGVSFAVFGNYLWRREKKENAPFLVLWIFSLSYALISYNMVYSMSLMWLDSVILLPAVLLGTEKIIDGKRGLHYMLSLAMVFFCNYYIGYMVGIFTAMYFLFRFCGTVKRTAVKASIFQGIRFVICTIMATALSAPLLLPAVKDLLQGKLAGDSGYHFELEPNFQLMDFFEKFRNGAYDSITNSGLPSVYCGMTVLMFALVFFLCIGISMREKIGAFVILLMLTLSFYYTGPNLAWHGFRAPVWFPFRYAFLFSAFLIYMAFRAACICCSDGVVDNLMARLKMTGAGIEKKGKKRSKKNKSKQKIQQKKIWNRTFFLYIRDGILMIILVLAVVDLTTNGQKLFAGLEGEFGYVKTDEYDGFVEKTKPLVEEIQRHDDGLYRVTATYEYSKNDAMLFGYNGMTHYSSTYNGAVNRLIRKLGIAQGHIWNSGYGASPLMDSLFAVAYKISDRQEPDCYAKIADYGKGAVGYRNDLALPIIYAASASTVTPDIWSCDDPYMNQNIFLNAISGRDEIYFREMVYDYAEAENGWCYSFTAEDSDPLYLYMYVGNGGWANVYVNDVWFGNYFSTETSCSLYIGSYAPGQQVTVRVEPAWGGTYASKAVIASLDMDTLRDTLDEVRAGGMEINYHKGGEIKGTISVREEQTIITSIPCDEGWSVWVDGEKHDKITFAETFLALEVPEGEHEIRFLYVSPGFYAGMIVFAAGLLMSVIYFVGIHRRH